eukprot:TRINITY_DN4686_c0_g2_i2.p1 TRINITY_DN4686_c0_g2~~TRINITY_DN4686_c0_g2_i2.p1  ORF type:complete len:358 (+),score=54.60 TRINITY_DN4686_c0_g2_i2:106-1179(+)
MQTWFMFIGETLTIFPLLYSRYKKRQEIRRQNKVLTSSINGTNYDVPVKQNGIFHYIFALPACCDLTASTLGGIGLLWVPASIWQMMRGAIIIFSGILSVIFLKKKLKIHNWLGMAIVILGLGLVGLAGFLKIMNESSISINMTYFFIGIVLVICAQIISASQMVVEEKFLDGTGYEPLNVVFMEGFWGLVIMSVIILPVVYFTPSGTPVYAPLNFNGTAKYPTNEAVNIYHDNARDALYQIMNFKPLMGFNIIYFSSIAFFNFFGLSVTQQLSAVHRTLIDACRTIFVWGVSLFLYYGAGLEDYGEKIDIYSLIQGGGFIFLVLGTFIYNGIIKLPCSSYGENEEDKPLLNDDIYD